MATMSISCQILKLKYFNNIIKSNNFKLINTISSYSTISQHQNYNNNKKNLLKNKNNDSVLNITFKKYYSIDESNEIKKRTLPTVMEFPELIWPSVLKTIKNFILVHFIIRPYFDREFNLPDFTAATKVALQVVSSKVSAGDLKGLNGLVAPETVSELKKSVSQMSVAQRNDLNVLKEDIYFSFPYQVGIMFDDETDNKLQKRFVEITMVYHVLKGLKEMRDRDDSPPINMGLMPEYRDKISICNYRFIKEFTQGNESDWTINIINHFKPSDYIRE